jgi:hypothetical protein
LITSIEALDASVAVFTSKVSAAVKTAPSSNKKG